MALPRENKMRLILILLFAYTHARYIENECNGIVINGVLQRKEVLKSNITNPYQLAIDYNTNTLFFSYSTEDANGFAIANLNLKTIEFANIKGINGGFANAVDNVNGIVYLGGNDGIYKYNYDSKEAKNLNLTNDNIWQLFYKDRLYYSSYPNEETYMINHGVLERVPQLVNTRAMLLSVDKYDNIYFSNSTGLFVHRKLYDDVIEIGEFTINGFTADLNGNIYFSTPSRLYQIDADKKKIINLLNLDDVIYGVAIDGTGDIIYAEDSKIIRLTPTGILCPTHDITTAF